jgi:ABC-type amino acid transport substrate-binding protein
MKKLLFVVLSVLLASGLPAQTLKLVTTDQLKPFQSLVLKVLKEAGVDATVVGEPQARLMADLGGGAVDGGFFLTTIALEQVPGLVKVGVPLYRNEIVAVAVSPDVKVASTADLAKYKVGIERGNKTHEAVVKNLSNVIPVDNQPTQFKMLAGGRFEVAISARALIPSLVKEAGIAKVYVQEPPVLVQPLFFVLTAKNQALVAKLTAAFKAEVDSGAWAKDLNAVIAPLNK